MDIKECEFDQPKKPISSTGLRPKMFNQDVGFRFAANVRAADPKEIDKMLHLFNKAAADFNAAWEAEKK
ncbi:MAG TPA: hypothetical protein VEI08_02770 [Candidatus Bathyarchaeia archaeon]|nr:hypothetical protein [Candidatus Bathyarchaeia archaeon]